VETFVHNEGYGFARILKEYSGYPADQPIYAVIPHGVYLNATVMLPHERDSGMPAVLNYPAFRAGVWQRESDKEVIPSASPFLYALAMFRERFGTAPKREGTLFFPAHTVARIRAHAHWDEVAEELLALDERFQPVTVCAYYADYWQGLHEPFRHRGMQIVSAGNHADPQFTYRWLHLVSRHEYVASNGVGSAVLYAAKTGVPAFLTRELVRYVPDHAMYALQRQRDNTQAVQTKQHLVSLFRADVDAPPLERAQTVDYLLGAENFKSPQDLRADLEHAASLAR